MVPAPEKSDWELVRLTVDRGDLSAFDAIVVRHQDRIHGLIYRLTGDSERAADLTQEAFLKAFRALRTFSGGAAFFTWLYRIARNAVTSAARFDAVRPVVSVSLSDSGDGDGPRVPTPVARGGDPVEHLLADERRDLLQKAVNALGLEFREVIVFRDFEDRSYEEIAELLDVPIGTVRSRLHRARAELKERLRPLLMDAVESKPSR